MATFQGTYRRGGKFIAVKFVRLSATERIEPGTELPSKEYPLKEFHLRSLFKRRIIGIADSPWTEAMLEAIDVKRASPETSKKPKKKKAAKKEAKPVEAKKEASTKKEKKKGSWNPFTNSE